MTRARPFLALAAATALLSACAATQSDAALATAATTPGFWLGVWHGFIFPVAVLVGLFVPDVAVYAVPNNGGFEKEEPRPAAAAPAPGLVPPASAHEQPAPATAAFVCPADMTCRPKRTPKPGEWNVGYLHHIHSGEEFGPAGVILSIASGLALLFFAFSGLWMYVYMFVKRSRKTHHHGGKFFW
jgi:hypothetical protein